MYDKDIEGISASQGTTFKWHIGEVAILKYGGLAHGIRTDVINMFARRKNCWVNICKCVIC